MNKNAIILIDSDRSDESSPLGVTKDRIIEEIENIGATAWVTKGKEIENYLPAAALAEWLTIDDVDQVGKYDNFIKYLNSINEREGERYTREKPLKAEQIIPHMTKENIRSVLDMAERLEEICKIIRRWNKI